MSTCDQEMDPDLLSLLVSVPDIWLWALVCMNGCSVRHFLVTFAARHNTQARKKLLSYAFWLFSDHVDPCIFCKASTLGHDHTTSVNAYKWYTTVEKLPNSSLLLNIWIWTSSNNDLLCDYNYMWRVVSANLNLCTAIWIWTSSNNDLLCDYNYMWRVVSANLNLCTAI